MLRLVLFAILAALPIARAAGWDDFSNNLATDLAPFLSLFGEQITKQYLSESVKPVDYFIFAMAPMGILTGVVSAIRVCGTPSLRAFIGRAQEGAGNAEAELCTSTSRDVCELYNSGGIARVFGRPKILEVVHDPGYDFSNTNDGTAGIYTFQEFIKSTEGKKLWGKNESGKGKSLWPWAISKKPDEEAQAKMDKPYTAYAPNLSLNIGIKKQPSYVFYAIAVVGLALQLGVLTFAGVATYYLKWGNDDKPPNSYACLLVIIGTVLVCTGMYYCAFLIGESTEESVWRRKSESKNESSMYWIQPGGQIVGDQTFDAFSYTDHDNRLENYMTSRRKNRNNTANYEIQVWIAIVITISGFILQFIGLRGIHSAVSVAQLGAIMVMSMARASLRTQRLKPGSNCFAKFPDEVLGRELDWLALRIGRNVMDGEIKNGQFSPAPGSASSISSIEKLSPASPEERHFWRVCGVPDMDKIRLERPSPDDLQNGAAKVLAYRTRLAGMTDSSASPNATTTSFKDEMVEVRNQSRELATLIAATIKTVLSKGQIKASWRSKIGPESEISQSIFWGIKCTVGKKISSTKDAVYKERNVFLELTQDLESPGKPWKLKNQLELEGILGLWLWSLKSDLEVEIKDPETGLISSTASDVQSRRIVPEDKAVRQGLEIWLGDDMQIITSRHFSQATKSADLGDASTVWNSIGQQSATANSNLRPAMHSASSGVRFFGRGAEQLSQSLNRQDTVFSSAPIQSSLIAACAQELFAAFLASILDIVDDIGPVNIQGTESFRLKNDLVSEMVMLFTEMRLGSRQEALLCVIPLVIPHLKDPSASKALKAARKFANEKRKEGEWRKAESVLQWVWKICAQSQHSCTTAAKTSESFAEQATVSLCELYRLALMDSTMRSLGETGLSSLNDQKAIKPLSACKNMCDIIDRYTTVKDKRKERRFASSDLLPAMEKTDLSTTLEIFTNYPPSQMESKMKGEALCIAARHGWTEVVLVLLESGGNPDYQDESRRTPFSYAAEHERVDIVKELSDWGIFPNSADNQYMTPLLYASQAGSDAIVELLLRDNRVSLDQVDDEQRTSLSHAALRGHDDVCKLLLNTGQVDPDRKDRYQSTPLSHAAKNGHETIVRLLLTTGLVDPDREDRYHLTPLSHAVKNGHEAVVKLLLDTGQVDPDRKDRYQSTPLSHAAKNGHETIVRLLLTTGLVDPDREDRYHLTPLSHAVKNGHEAVVKLLLDTGQVNPDRGDQLQSTPLSHAATNGHETIVRLLLDTGQVDPDRKSQLQLTPLSYAAEKGHEAVVRLLLATGYVDPDARDDTGMTPLTCAVRMGYEAIVKLLISTGKVDLNNRDKYHHTPFYWAGKRRNKAILKLLCDAEKAKLDTKNDDSPILSS